MGLTLSVGNPDSAFKRQFAARVKSALSEDYPGQIRLDAEDAPYYSEELPWSGWAALQDRALQVMTEAELPHLLSMEAWQGCFLPVEVEPELIEFEGEGSSLDVASLPRLIEELELVGSALGLATDDASLCEMSRPADHDDENSWHVLTFAELLRAARIAASRRQALWVVK